jgi:predicted dehydrogenase
VCLVQEKKLLSYVGYCFRFHPLVQEFKKKLEGLTVLHARVLFSSYMPDWRTKKNYQSSYIVHKSQGGGVILDCSHEIDLAEYFFGAVKTITGTAGRLSALTVDAEDYADMVLKHPQTVTALHLDFFSRVTQRYVEASTADLFLKLDLKKNKISVGREGDLQETSYDVDRDLMYREQLRYFFDHLASGKPMMNSIPQASSLFEKLMAFRERGTNP